MTTNINIFVTVAKFESVVLCLVEFPTGREDEILNEEELDFVRYKIQQKLEEVPQALGVVVGSPAVLTRHQVWQNCIPDSMSSKVWNPKTSIPGLRKVQKEMIEA